MKMTEFVRKPFVIEAIQITNENIEEVAKEIGFLSKTDNGEKFIIVDRNTVPVVRHVYVGYWMTRYGHRIRCYTPRSFLNQFIELTDQVLERPVAIILDRDETGVPTEDVPVVTQ